MKKLLLSLLAVLSICATRADEGMWIPMLIGRNYDEMARMGLKLSKDDLYNINHSSLKDAIVIFGAGCTGEVISGSGLVLTNHHCGYEAIAGLSTVDKNYLDNGFWAHSMSEEQPAPGLSVMFLERMEDVTAEVNAAVRNAKGDRLAKRLEAIKKKIEDRAALNGKYVANVKEFFNGNQYFLLVYKKYTDIRLVGNPPKALGKFGGDTDNWMWPRHTADFSMFRIYAGADNEPAAYSASNKPYQPKKFLPVSIKGEQEGDYAMIFGYPGRTNRYEVSAGIEVALSEINPSIVNIREKRLAIMRKHMDKDKLVYLKMTSNYSKIANYWKYYIGQTEQLKRLKVVDRKKEQEAAFARWARNNDEDYTEVLPAYGKAFAAYRPYAKHAVYYSEAFKAPVLSRLGAALEPLRKALDRTDPDKDTLNKYTAQLKTARAALLKDFDLATDKEIFAAMTKMFYDDVTKSQHPDIYQRVIFKRFGAPGADKTYEDYADWVYSSSFLLDMARFSAFVDSPTIQAINADPAADYALSFVHNYETWYQPKIDAFNTARKELGKQYIRGLMEMKKDSLFYPDANSTMRISYGKVGGYTPQDAVSYDYFTTLDGLIAKYQPGDDEFDVPKDLLTLYKNKDYGRYKAADGTMHTCFITNNDITGGNSGSPVINGEGELIGLAFDGNWEAMSGDIAFDKQYKRTICVDTRFILFLIEKLGKASNLIEEMEVHN